MHRALITLFFFLKVIGIEKKTARGKVTKLKEKLKEARAEVQQKCRGKGKGKGKGKALTSEKVVALEAQIAEEEGNCIRGTMNDKTVDLLQVCLQGAISTLYFTLLYTCRFTMGMPSGATPMILLE